MPFKDLWLHLLRHFNNSYGYPNLLTLASLAILIIADTSCCEQGFSRVNSTLTKQRNRTDLESLRDHLHIQMLGPDIKDFDPLPLVQKWLDEPFEDGGNGARGRELGALLRKISDSELNRRII